MAQQGVADRDARRRMAVLQSSPPDGRPISLKTTSTIASIRSSLLATWRYSAIGATSSISASVRMRERLQPAGVGHGRWPSAAPAPCSGAAATQRPDRVLVAIPCSSLCRRARRLSPVLTVYSVRSSVYIIHVDRVHRTLADQQRGLPHEGDLQDRYGSAEVLAARDIEKPEIGDARSSSASTRPRSTSVTGSS